MKEDTTHVRVSKKLRKKLKIKAAQEEITIAQLLDELLKDKI